MLRLWFFIYNIFLLPLLWIGFKILSVFNTKIKDGFSGREKIFETLLENNFILKNGKKNIIIHSSSLGEYQQAIPIIEEFQSHNNNIILTFFSPSGYKNSKINFKDAFKIYLPFDSVNNIRKFLNIIKPEMILMMRYDLWFNFLYEAKKRNIKTVIANARFDENDKTWRVPVLKSFKRNLFGMIDKIFVIDDDDEKNFNKELKTNKADIIKVGDSKFERVYKASASIKKNGMIDDKIIKNKKIFVIGSSWKDDEDILLPVIDKIIENEKDLLTILVPHEPKETKLLMIEKNIEQQFSNLKSIRFSNLNNYSNENLIIVDSIGKLMNLYSIAYVSYVGGGFKSGLHNILEPVIFNMPVFFANEVKNSDEDEVLIENGCGILVKEQKQFYKDFRRILSDTNLRNDISSKCKKVFDKKLGTAKKIVENLTN